MESKSDSYSTMQSMMILSLIEKDLTLDDIARHMHHRRLTNVTGIEYTCPKCKRVHFVSPDTKRTDGMKCCGLCFRYKEGRWNKKTVTRQGFKSKKTEYSCKSNIRKMLSEDKMKFLINARGKRFSIRYGNLFRLVYRIAFQNEMPIDDDKKEAASVVESNLKGGKNYAYGIERLIRAFKREFLPFSFVDPNGNIKFLPTGIVRLNSFIDYFIDSIAHSKASVLARFVNKAAEIDELTKKDIKILERFFWVCRAGEENLPNAMKKAVYAIS